MRYLVTTEGYPAFLTKWFDPKNHFIPGMVVYDLAENKYTTDGKNWNEIKIDQDVYVKTKDGWILKRLSEVPFEEYPNIGHIDNVESLDILPLFPNLNSLEICSSIFNEPLNNLSDKLTSLKLWNCNSFDQQLYKLKLFKKEYYYVYKRVPNLPENLEELVIESKKFDQSVNELPTNLRKLNISSDSFNQPLDRSIEH